MSNPNEAPGNSCKSKERQRASIEAAKKCLAEVASIKNNIREMEIEADALELEAKAHLIRANVRQWKIVIGEMSADLIVLGVNSDVSFWPIHGDDTVYSIIAQAKSPVLSIRHRTEIRM